jgi:glucokinase
MLVLAADVGGTNTRLAICRGTTPETDTVRRFENARYGSLEDVLAAYRTEIPTPVAAACVAVAGPVSAGTGRLTNRDWEITAPALCAATGAGAGYVINDLEAQGHALDHVAGNPIFGGPADPSGTRLVVGVGTGFNAAPVHRTRAGTHVAASEAGHVSLPVWDAESLRLARSIQHECAFASVEEVLSGRGLLRLLAHVDGTETAGMDGHDILAKARATPDSAAARAVALMAEILGRVVGDLALIHLPGGGVYIIGGMARALAPWIAGPDFVRGYLDKGRFSDFLRSYPVALVEDDFAALTGCAGFVLRAS